MRGGPDHEWWCRVCLKARGQDDQTLIVDAVTARSDSNRPCPQAVLDAAGQTTTSRWRAVSDGRGPTGGSEGGWGVRGSLATGTAAKYSNRGNRTKPGKITASRLTCTPTWTQPRCHEFASRKVSQGVRLLSARPNSRNVRPLPLMLLVQCCP